MISEAVDRAVKAKWRADLVNMLTDAGRTLEHANLRANGSVYQDINVGLLLLKAARSLQECQDEPEPENPDDVVVKVTVPDRWAMTEAWQRSAMAAAPVVHGQWIIGVDDDDFDVKCSKCEGTDIFEVAGIAAVERIAKTMHYCPNGGAKMDGGKRRARRMTDYISREAAIAYIREQSEECQKAFEELGGESGIYADAYNDLADNFYSIPAADVAPVVRGSGSGKPMVESVQPLTAQAAPKPMTNGDRIRAMTDEELAESDELLSGLCNVLHGQGYPCEANTCRECLIKWLGSPEKEDAPEPVTSGDRIRDRKDEELEERERLEKLFAERERLERLFEEARQIADRRAWDETSRTMADSCGQEANDE